MKLPTHLDPAIKAIFDDPDKPSEQEYQQQLNARYEIPIDTRWVNPRGYVAQQEFLLRQDVIKRRRKNRK